MNRPANIDPPLEAILDIELERCGWKQADAIWHRATDALMRRDYARFDELMREFRSISDTWESTPRDGGGDSNSPPTD